MYHRYQPTENGQWGRQTLPSSPAKGESRPPQSAHRPSAAEEAAVPPRKGQIPVAAQTAVNTQDSANLPPPRFQLPFLEKLLPNADNGDLLLLLIMLLLLSEGNEDSTSVVMTLAIFLFLQ